MKKLFLLMLALAITLCVFVSCGNDETPETKREQTRIPDRKERK